MRRVTAIVCSLDTETVTSACLVTLRTHHPLDLDIHLCVPRGSERWAGPLCEEVVADLHVAPKQMHHAEALQFMWDQVGGDLVAIIDSDTTFHAPFLGKMQAQLGEKVWAVGIDGPADTHGGLAWMDGRAPWQPGYVMQPRVHPCLALLDRTPLLEEVVARFGFYLVLRTNSGELGKCWDVMGFLGEVMDYLGYRAAYVPAGDEVHHWGCQSWHWSAASHTPTFQRILEDYRHAQ